MSRPVAHTGAVLAILRVPGVLPLFLASCVARLPMGALGLLLVLHTKDLTGSYARGGAAAATYALAIGLSGPALARTIDRRGQAGVLRVGAALAAAALVTLALLPADSPFWAILAAAAVAGVSQPPVGACMRALWPALLDDADRRHTAYSLEGAMLEIVYMAGPVLIVAGVGSWSPTAALVLCAAFVLGGNLLFSSLPASREWRPEGARPTGRMGALEGSGVRVLLVVFVLCGMAIGAVEVAVPALLDAMGKRPLTGLLFGLWGIGSMAAGFVVARLGPGDDPPRRLAVLLVAWGAAHAAIGLANSPLAVGLLLLAAGVSIAPTMVSANGMLDHLAPSGTLTEAFSWTSTGLTVGIAAGSALAGALTEAASPGAAMAILGAGGVLAAGLVAVAASGPLAEARPSPAAARR
jgi:MFS family permease